MVRPFQSFSTVATSPFGPAYQNGTCSGWVKTTTDSLTRTRSPCCMAAALKPASCHSTLAAALWPCSKTCPPNSLQPVQLQAQSQGEVALNSSIELAIGDRLITIAVAVLGLVAALHRCGLTADIGAQARGFALPPGVIQLIELIQAPPILTSGGTGGWLWARGWWPSGFQGGVQLLAIGEAGFLLRVSRAMAWRASRAGDIHGLALDLLAPFVAAALPLPDCTARHQLALLVEGKTQALLLPVAAGLLPGQPATMACSSLVSWRSAANCSRSLKQVRVGRSPPLGPGAPVAGSATRATTAPRPHQADGAQDQTLGSRERRGDTGAERVTPQCRGFAGGSLLALIKPFEPQLPLGVHPEAQP